MGASEIWLSFTEEEKAILRRALHLKARDRRQDEFLLVSKYWRLMKSRSKHRTEGQVDARLNSAYREWLQVNNLPLEPFDDRTYRQWKRGYDRWKPR